MLSRIRIAISVFLLLVMTLSCQTQTGSTTVADEGKISKTQNMSAARAAHTSTLLQDGRILVTGGFVAEDHTLASAEFFDPKSNSFFAAPNMNERRSAHTATLLPNGKVLIAGGFNGDYLASAELFDPKANRFLPIADMTSPRSNHIAVLLKNGKVLLAGGVGTGWTFLSSAEIFDPETNTFSKTGDMMLARESHTATLQQNGKVLIAGGHSGRRSEMRVYSQTEVYDPQARTFSAAGEMTIRRHKHESVLLNDGRVLIVGGSNERDSEGSYNSAETFDPKTGKFAAVSSMTRSRYKIQGAVVLLPDGKVFIAGGTNDAEIFDPITNSFSLISGSMGDEKLFATATPLKDGRVLVTGGYNRRIKASSDAWIFRM